MASLSIDVFSRGPRAALMTTAMLFGLAACQPQSRAAAGEGTAVPSGDIVAETPAPPPPPTPAPKPESPPAPAQIPATDAAPGTVVLGFGDEATVAPGTQLRFVRVVNDSRCPKDVQCVWAGEVTIEFELKSRSGKSHFELASSRAPATAVGTMQFELKAYGACPPASNRLADAECATVAVTTAATR